MRMAVLGHELAHVKQYSGALGGAIAADVAAVFHVRYKRSASSSAMPTSRPSRSVWGRSVGPCALPAFHSAAIWNRGAELNRNIICCRMRLSIICSIRIKIRIRHID